MVDYPSADVALTDYAETVIKIILIIDMRGYISAGATLLIPLLGVWF